MNDRSTALDRLTGGFQGDDEMIDPRGMDIRASREQTEQMRMAIEAQNQQAAAVREGRRVQVAMQIVGMDVSKATASGRSDGGGGAPQFDRDADKPFWNLRDQAIALLAAELDGAAT